MTIEILKLIYVFFLSTLLSIVFCLIVRDLIIIIREKVYKYLIIPVRNVLEEEKVEFEPFYSRFNIKTILLGTVLDKSIRILKRLFLIKR